jgi:hypothetical protein
MSTAFKDKHFSFLHGKRRPVAASTPAWWARPGKNRTEDIRTTSREVINVGQSLKRRITNSIGKEIFVKVSQFCDANQKT